MVRIDTPVELPLGSLTLSAHLLLEVLAYAVAARVYFRGRSRRGDVIGEPDRWSVIVAAVVGAAIGSKLLHHLNSPSALALNYRDPLYLLGGKTIVGALLGGLLAVEAAKRYLGIRTRTGDLFAMPLCAGLAVGRIGCFLHGLADDTVGLASSLPFAVDFGDGIPRHPTQLYEIAFVTLLGIYLLRRTRAELEPGRLFQHFMLAYMSFRLAVDGLKPRETLAGLSAIQWVALGLVIYYVRLLLRRDR